MQLKKYTYDPVTLTPKMLYVVIPMPDTLNLSHLRSNWPGAEEELLPEHDDNDAMEIDVPAGP